MKKLFALVAIVGVMTSCKDKKDDKTTQETTTVTPVDATTTTTPTDNTTTTVSTNVPTFSDPEVQKFANEYAAFISEYKAGMKDPARLNDLTKKMTDWSSRSQQIGMKLSQSPEEAKKWSDWVMAVSKEMMPPQ